MRKIDKTKILSTVYKEWEQELEEHGKDHPKWRADYRYYLDVVMNLFYCQQGLCAYTEISLCPLEYFDPENWQDGRYCYSEKPEFFGQVEHFDKKRKEKKGWLWNNLFMVHTDINSSKVKGSEETNDILKPDKDEYDPYKLFEYDKELHLFIPNTDLSEDSQQKIKVMILTLGINFGSVKYERERTLNKHISMIEFDKKTWDDLPNEFPTAFDMCKKMTTETAVEIV